MPVPWIWRGLLVVMAVAAGVFAGPAAAAVPCSQAFTDAAGDTMAVGADGSQPIAPIAEASDPSLDILSVKISASTRRIDVVIRVADLGSYAPTSPTADAVGTVLGTGERRWSMHGERDATGRQAFFVSPADSNVSTDVVEIQGQYDVAANSIRMSAPISAFVGLSRGSRLTSTSAVRQRSLGIMGSQALQIADGARSSAVIQVREVC